MLLIFMLLDTVTVKIFIKDIRYFIKFSRNIVFLLLLKIVKKYINHINVINIKLLIFNI